MAQSRWRLNDTSVVNGGLYTRDSGTLWTLQNNSGTTATLVSSPTPQEGERCLPAQPDGGRYAQVIGLSNTDGQQFWYDFMWYIPSPAACIGLVLGIDPLYNWMAVEAAGSFNVQSYANGYYELTSSSASSVVPFGSWNRFRVGHKRGTGINSVALFKGANLLGTTPDVSIPGHPDNYGWDNGFNNVYFQGNATTSYIDDLIVDDTAAPSRTTSFNPATSQQLAF